MTRQKGNHGLAGPGRASRFLVIREEQMAAFKLADERRFILNLASHLLTHYPTLSAKLGGKAEVAAFARRAIVNAHGFGVQSKGAVTALAELTIQFGENFERSPIREWTLNILAHPELPGYAKAEVIRERHHEQTEGRVLIPV